METAEVGGGRVRKQENLAAVLSYLNCSSLLKTAIALCSFFQGSLPPFLPEAQLRKGALSKNRSPFYFCQDYQESLSLTYNALKPPYIFSSHRSLL